LLVGQTPGGAQHWSDSGGNYSQNFQIAKNSSENSKPLKCLEVAKNLAILNLGWNLDGFGLAGTQSPAN